MDWGFTYAKDLEDHRRPDVRHSPASMENMAAEGVTHQRKSFALNWLSYLDNPR